MYENLNKGMGTKVELARVHYLYNTGIFSGLCIAIGQKRKQCLVYFAKKKILVTQYTK